MAAAEVRSISLPFLAARKIGSSYVKIRPPNGTSKEGRQGEGDSDAASAAPAFGFSFHKENVSSTDIQNIKLKCSLEYTTHLK